MYVTNRTCHEKTCPLDFRNIHGRQLLIDMQMKDLSFKDILRD